MLQFDPYSSGIDFSRQNMTSVDVRFWQLKFKVQIFKIVVDP